MSPTSEYRRILSDVSKLSASGELTRDKWESALSRARKLVDSEWLEALYNFAMPAWAPKP